MKKKIIAIILVLLCSLSFAENKNSSLHKNNQPLAFSTSYVLKSKSIAEAVTESLFDACIDVCSEVFVYLLLYNNLYSTYDEFPYAYSDNYVVLTNDMSQKSYRGELEFGLSYFPQADSYLADVRLEALIWKFFGPVVEYQFVGNYLTPFNQSQERNYFYNRLLLGGQLSIFQTSILSMSGVVQWSCFHSNYYLDGLTLGYIFRSYPVKPIVIEWRGSFTINNDDSFINEQTVELGIMQDRMEMFIAYKLFEYTLSNESDFNFDHGISAGAKFHF